MRSDRDKPVVQAVCSLKEILLVLLLTTGLNSSAQLGHEYSPRVTALLDSCRTFQEMDSLGAAIELADQALVLLANDPTGRAGVELRIAKFYHRLSAYEKGLEHTYAALSLNDGTDVTLHYAALNTLGLLHYRMGHRADATEAFDQVLEYFQDSDDSQMKAFALNNLGMLEDTGENPEKALEYFYESLAIKIQLMDSAGVTRTYNNIGTVYARLAKPDSALRFYSLSLELKRKLDDGSGIASTLGNIGELYGSIGEFDSARVYLESARVLADSIASPAVQVGILHNLAELHRALGDHEEALRFKEEFIAVNTRLQNERYDGHVADLKVGYDLERKNATIKALENEADVRRVRLWMTIALAIALLVLVILLVITVRARVRTLKHREEAFEKQKEIDVLRIEAASVQNAKLSEAVEYKTRELASMATHAYQKNQLLHDMLEKVEAEGGKKDPSLLVRDLQRSIKQNIDLDADWEQFKVHFTEVHAQFFETLLQRSPTLSQTNLRHCAYIRLKLSTKEIARLLNIVPSSVQIARVRLKKKLDLGRDQDLHDFIQTIDT